jgi:hypothetical protein
METQEFKKSVLAPPKGKKMNLLADMFSPLIDCMHNLILDMVATIF